jgi:hypothetical protein
MAAFPNDPGEFEFHGVMRRVACILNECIYGLFVNRSRAHRNEKPAISPDIVCAIGCMQP